MKHLKSIFEKSNHSQDQFRKDVYDILQELRDDGFTAYVSTKSGQAQGIYSVIISKDIPDQEEALLKVKAWFRLSEVSDTILRICDYASSNNIKYRVFVNGPSGWSKLPLQSPGSRSVELTTAISPDFSKIDYKFPDLKIDYVGIHFNCFTNGEYK